MCFMVRKRSWNDFRHVVRRKIAVIRVDPIDVSLEMIPRGEHHEANEHGHNGKQIERHEKLRAWRMMPCLRFHRQSPNDFPIIRWPLAKYLLLNLCTGNCLSKTMYYLRFKLNNCCIESQFYGLGFEAKVHCEQFRLINSKMSPQTQWLLCSNFVASPLYQFWNLILMHAWITCSLNWCWYISLRVYQVHRTQK